MANDRQLLLFTRYPEAGTTKTRLIDQLGAKGAALLQQKLTERVVGQADLLKESEGIPTQIYYAGGSIEKMAAWLGPKEYIVQVGGDLGARMRGAFCHAFAGGASAAVLIGSDIPEIGVSLLRSAFTGLIKNDVVIGPSADGGYYLVGLTQKKAIGLLPLLFEQMAWSTSTVFATTKHRLETAGYRVAVLPVLRDIDLPADLDFARQMGLI